MAEATGASSVAVPNSASAPSPEAPATDFRQMKHKVKIDGQDLDVGYEDLIKGFQKASSADRRFQDAANFRKQYEPIAKTFEEIKQGKLDRMLELVPEEQFRKLAEDYLIKHIELQNLPEGDRRALKLEKDLAAKDAELKKLQADANKEQVEQANAQAFKEIDEEISGAVKATGKKPTPRLIARIAEDMLANLDATGSKLNAKDALSRSIRDIHSDIAEYLPTLSAEELRKLLPKQALDALRKADVDDVMSQDPIGRSRQKSEAPKLVRKDEKRGSTEDIFNRLERKIGGNRR